MQLASRFIVTSAVCVALAAGAASLRGGFEDLDPIVGLYEGTICGESQESQNGKPLSYTGFTVPLECSFAPSHEMFAIFEGTWKKKGSKYKGDCSAAFQTALEASALDGEKVKGVVRWPAIRTQTNGVFGTFKAKKSIKANGNAYKLKQSAQFCAFRPDPPVQA